MKNTLLLFAFVSMLGLGACDNKPKTSTTTKTTTTSTNSATGTGAPSVAAANGTTAAPAATPPANGNAVPATAAPQERTAGQALDDTVVTTRVKAAIAGDKSLPVTDIHVETVKGVVQLSGFVNSQATITRAGEIAKGVQGVQSVKNDLRLR